MNKNIHDLLGKYDEAGYGRDGFDREGFNRFGYDREGLNRNGYDREGVSRFQKFTKH